MGGNPKESPWRSTPRAKRKTKGIELMLTDEARAKLDRLGVRYGSRSAAVEKLITDAEEP